MLCGPQSFWPLARFGVSYLRATCRWNLVALLPFYQSLLTSLNVLVVLAIIIRRIYPRAKDILLPTLSLRLVKTLTITGEISAQQTLVKGMGLVESDAIFSSTAHSNMTMEHVDNDNDF